MAAELNLSKSVVHEIVHKKLKFQNVSFCRVSKQLTERHKFLCLNISFLLLGHHIAADGDIQEHTITVDETWGHHVTLEVKSDPMFIIELLAT